MLTRCLVEIDRRARSTNLNFAKLPPNICNGAHAPGKKSFALSLNNEPRTQTSLCARTGKQQLPECHEPSRVCNPSLNGCRGGSSRFVCEVDHPDVSMPSFVNATVGWTPSGDTLPTTFCFMVSCFCPHARVVYAHALSPHFTPPPSICSIRPKHFALLFVVGGDSRGLGLVGFALSEEGARQFLWWYLVELTFGRGEVANAEVTTRMRFWLSTTV